jgi:DnaJ-domain-containing protein 1
MFVFNIGTSSYTMSWLDCLIVIAFLLAFCYMVYYLALELVKTIKQSKINEYWESGLIPPNFDKTPQHLFEIYIVAATVIVVRDPQRFADKFSVVSRLLSKKFPNEFYEFVDSYTHSLRHIVKIDSLVNWSNSHLSKEEKIDLVNYMTELSVVDGFFTDEERMYLLVFMQRINIQFLQLEEKYHSYFEPKKTNNESIVKISKRATYYVVLGVSESASPAEIKAAYRSLAKLTHPDRYMKQPEAVREKMKRKFQEIQEAYEMLLR